jgi:hypothetical protein
LAWGADDWEELSAGEIRSGTITIYDDNDNPIVSERCASSAPKPECGLAPAKRVKTERVQTDRQTTERVQTNRQTTSTERVESSSDATRVTTTRVEKSSSSSSSYTKTVHPRSVPEPPSPSSPPWSPVDSESDKEEEEEDDDAPDPEQAKELETDLKLIRLAKALGSLPQGEVHYAARVKKPVLVKHNIVDSSATPKRKPASKKSKARK